MSDSTAIAKNLYPQTVVYYRLIALWVLTEAMLGGMIHGLRIPVSGLVVGSAAVLCISLIAWYHPVRGAIIKATVIVAIFKLVLSPQASFPAYIAVFFQGMAGELLFRGRRNFRIACFVLAIAALIESGAQRILVLTIVYGNDIWSAINDIFSQLAGTKNGVDVSRWLISIYLLAHLAAGAAVGWFAASLPMHLDRARANANTTAIDDSGGKFNLRKKRRNRVFIIVWAALLLLLIQSSVFPASAWLPQNRILNIFTRSLVILLGWTLFAGPLMRKLLGLWLAKKRSAYSREISAIEELLPGIRQILLTAWKQRPHPRRFFGVKTFLLNVFSAVVHPGPRVFVLTGPVNSGKTTFLRTWARENDAGGIITPRKDGSRVFEDISGGVSFPMEENEGEILEVGRYRFSKAAFSKASQIICSSVNRHQWVVIDEVGPLELRGQGFSDVLREVLRNHHQNILIVVRNGLEEEVRKKFSIKTYPFTFTQRRTLQS